MVQKLSAGRAFNFIDRKDRDSERLFVSGERISDAHCEYERAKIN